MIPVELEPFGTQKQLYFSSRVTKATTFQEASDQGGKKAKDDRTPVMVIDCARFVHPIEISRLEKEKKAESMKSRFKTKQEPSEKSEQETKKPLKWVDFNTACWNLTKDKNFKAIFPVLRHMYSSQEIIE